MLELGLMLVGGLLTIAGAYVNSGLREREAVKGEGRAQVRRVRQVVFALLCVRDEVRELSTGLAFLRVLQSENSAGEEELRQQLMADRGVTIDKVVGQVEALLPGLSEVDPFSANLVKINVDILAKQIQQDYMSLAGGPVYSAFREDERRRLDDVMTMIDGLFDHLAEEADLPPERIKRAVQSKETRIAALEQSMGIRIADQPPDADDEHSGSTVP